MSEKSAGKLMSVDLRRFILSGEGMTRQSPWTVDEWLCGAELVKNEHLLLVRATMEPQMSHPFHTHPHREELIYVLSGQAEQWVGSERRILKPGEVAFIPTGEPHGTYNPFPEKLVFLAILSPSNASGPAMVDVSKEEPWASVRLQKDIEKNT